MVTSAHVCIAGLGAIGRKLAQDIDAGEIPGLTLGAVSAKDKEKASAFVATLKTRVPIVELTELADYGDIVIECAPAELLASIAEAVLKQGKHLVVLSAGALLSNLTLIDMARETGGVIHVPTGALLGMDAVQAAAEGEVHAVRMVTRKPPAGLVGAPYLIEHGINVENVTEPLRVFSGTAREAAKGFPANLNVAVTLSLAGVGPDETLLEIWADPTVTRNTHQIEVDSDSARLTMTIENIPSANPKTGLITAHSVIALLRKMTSSLRVGT